MNNETLKNYKNLTEYNQRNIDKDGTNISSLRLQEVPWTTTFSMSTKDALSKSSIKNIKSSLKFVNRFDKPFYIRIIDIIPIIKYQYKQTVKTIKEYYTSMLIKLSKNKTEDKIKIPPII
jgi:ribosomal protein S1